MLTARARTRVHCRTVCSIFTIYVRQTYEYIYKIILCYVITIILI